MPPHDRCSVANVSAIHCQIIQLGDEPPVQCGISQTQGTGITVYLARLPHNHKGVCRFGSSRHNSSINSFTCRGSKGRFEFLPVGWCVALTSDLGPVEQDVVAVHDSQQLLAWRLEGTLQHLSHHHRSRFDSCLYVTSHQCCAVQVTSIFHTTHDTLGIVDLPSFLVDIILDNEVHSEIQSTKLTIVVGKGGSGKQRSNSCHKNVSQDVNKTNGAQYFNQFQRGGKCAINLLRQP